MNNQPALNSITNRDVAAIYRSSIIAIFVLVVAGVLFNETDLNTLISSQFADGVNGFPFRTHWLVKGVLHDAAAKLSGILATLLIAFNLHQLFKPTTSWRTIISARYIMWSWLSTTLIIGYLKSITKLPCPWNILQFGGQNEYLSLLNTFSSQYSVGHCFPSAHATGGYGLIGLVFVVLLYGRPLRFGLFPALFVGALYGAAQMVRGAHFLSHDLFSIALCLGSALFWARFYLYPRVLA